MRISLPILAALALLAMSGIALADDWTAVRLRGQMLELVGKQWQPIGRGAVVADGTAVRSLGNGYADFVRGTETLSIGPNTQIKIADQAVAGSKPFTTVTEYLGTVEIDADVENVKHFAVETPYLAAVVKGTRFVVTSGPGGASVTVDRGHVAVSDFADHTHVTVTVGQTATVTAHHRSRKDGLTVSGAGDLPPVLDDPATKSSAAKYYRDHRRPAAQATKPPRTTRARDRTTARAMTSPATEGAARRTMARAMAACRATARASSAEPIPAADWPCPPSCVRYRSGTTPLRARSFSHSD